MKIGKAPEILKKAAAMVRSKTGVLSSRLLVLASPRRRMATVGAISHRIHALVAAADRPEKATCRVDCDGKALVLRKAERKPVLHGSEIVDLSELALFDQEDDDGGACPDWTHSLFNDDDGCCYTDEDKDGSDDDDDDLHHGVLLDACDDDDEPSVMDVIRSNREVEGLEFNMDDEIDQAADMFIRRFRSRMNRSL